MTFTDSINALTADGLKFAHPLQHLGKSSGDLPIIAIDSFKHMYLFKNDVKSQLGYVYIVIFKRKYGVVTPLRLAHTHCSLNGIVCI